MPLQPMPPTGTVERAALDVWSLYYARRGAVGAEMVSAGEIEDRIRPVQRAAFWFGLTLGGGSLAVWVLLVGLGVWWWRG